MPNDFELDHWIEAQEYQVQLNAEGEIIDFLDPEVTRPNKPEERIRQRMGQVLHFELGYPKELMAFERVINIGSEKKRADIVIFLNKTACANNDQGQIFLISETKAPTEKEPDGQLVSYISASSAEGGFWTNGNSIHYHRKLPGQVDIVTWTGIPKFGNSWDSIGKYKKSELIMPIDLKMAFKRCHNAIYRTGIDSEDVALDMVRIILSKVEDESSANEDCVFHITPEEFQDADKKKVACQRARGLFNAVKGRYPDVFGASETITASDDQLAIVMAQLQQYSLLDAPHDVIGTAYEIYVASHLKGERGQFFTNRLVIEMMVKMLDPNEKTILLDPSCGSGGFLIAAMNYIFSKIDSSARTANAKEILKRSVVHNLFGVDISPKLVKIAKANMLIGKDGHGGIERANSLDDTNKLSSSFREKAGLERVTMILTNPPFGAGHDVRIKEPYLLRNFESGKVFNLEDGKIKLDDKLNSNQGVAPEILFLERCIRWLKPGGVLGIVMAKGQLDNREAYYIRHHALQACKLLAVVNLHEDTFEPFCGSKASVIFLHKTDGKPPANYKIFMAISNKVGQTSRGEAIIKKDADGKPIIRNNSYVLDEDLSEIAADYGMFIKGQLKDSAFRFTINRRDISLENLSLNPVQYLPAHSEAFNKVMKLGDSDDFEIHTLGSLGRVFNGPRFKRPYADHGVVSGPTILKYFTGTALTQLNSDNIKYLDRSKANAQTQKHLDALVIRRGNILISDSGTLGRVTYALKQHDGHLATNNLIRVIIQDENLRGYVYEFLKGDVGQKLMLKNAYGTNQEHLEPDVIADIPIPVPKDKKLTEKIGQKVIQSINQLEDYLEASEEAKTKIAQIFTV
jgi:type I restriction enzyme M protein